MSPQCRSGRRSPSRRGFTLLELLMALTILGIAIAFAGPRIATLTSKARAQSAAQQLVGDLGRARIEAIKRNTAVAFTRTDSATYSITYVGSRSLDGATFTSGPDSILFAPFGPPLLGGGTFVVDVNGYTRSVTVSAAGHASVQ